MTPHVLLDPGHGGMIFGKYQTPGKRSPIWGDIPQLFEGVQNRDICERVKKLLTIANIPFTDIVNSNDDVSRPVRISRANGYYKSNKDCVLISIHADGAGDGKNNHPATGISIYTSIGKTKSDVLATEIIRAAEPIFLNSVKWRTDLTDKDKDKEKDFDMTKLVHCPAVLCEFGFMTNRIECEKMHTEEWKNNCANAIVNGIKKYYELD